VCAQDVSSEVVREALVRVQAELQAAGFSADQTDCSEVAAEIGLIELTVENETVEIRATSVASHGTMTQVADLRQPTISAEVIAVRAVEALRAVLLQSLKSGEVDGEGISTPLREFTQFGQPAPPDPAPVPDLPPEVPAARPKPQAPPRSTPRPRRERLSALLSVGPAVEVVPGANAWMFGGEARGIIQYHGLSLGVVGYAGFVPARFKLGESRAEALSWSILFRPGVALPCGPLWECHLGVLVGLNQVAFNVPDAGQAAEDVRIRHQSWCLQGDALFGRFFASGIGGTLGLRAGSLLNAPVLVSAQDGAEVTWGRPLFSASIALAYRM